jgi:hypothetical protein
MSNMAVKGTFCPNALFRLGASSVVIGFCYHFPRAKRPLLLRYATLKPSTKRQPMKPAEKLQANRVLLSRTGHVAPSAGFQRVSTTASSANGVHAPSRRVANWVSSVEK